MTSSTSTTTNERSNNGERTYINPHAWLMLECGISDLMAWGGVLRDLGSSANQVNGDSLIVIGNALDTLAGRMHADWESMQINVGRAG